MSEEEVVTRTVQSLSWYRTCNNMLPLNLTKRSHDTGQEETDICPAGHIINEYLA